MYEEMCGVAQGAKVDILDIIALNVRTEINFGLYSDGCSAYFIQTPKHTVLAQNWDWHDPQKENLIVLHIDQQSPLPSIKMVTEAGIIGKIGFNSAKVGVCLNAIRCQGVDIDRIPVHLALRQVLNSTSRDEALKSLATFGVASSAHLLIADDETGGMGLETTSKSMERIPMDKANRIIHTNHLVCPTLTASDDSYKWMPDSTQRLERLDQLVQFDSSREPTFEEFRKVFSDEKGAPTAIRRTATSPGTTSTLFNIVMELKSRNAAVGLGKPPDFDEELYLAF